MPDTFNLRSTAAYRYELPPERIAREPADPADTARLLSVPANGTMTDYTFSDFPELLRPSDVLVINRTRVIRARLRGEREPGGGAAEILVLHPAEHERFDPRATRWLALVKPGRKLREGARVRISGDAVAIVEAVEAGGERVVRFESPLPFDALLDRYGELPLPPYVGPGDAAREARYQTIFAQTPGSVAAPTASLHFTPRVLERLEARGVSIVPLVLDVGLGTFKPIETEKIDGHVMHAETYDIPETTAQTIARAKEEGRRIVVAGTTAMRALEAAAIAPGVVEPGARSTSLFITPGYDFKIADVLLTNFHLPGSTLLVLVSAFAGYERTMLAYETAIARKYRFYSFGDAMLIERALSA